MAIDFGMNEKDQRALRKVSNTLKVSMGTVNFKLFVLMYVTMNIPSRVS